MFCRGYAARFNLCQSVLKMRAVFIFGCWLLSDCCRLFRTRIRFSISLHAILAMPIGLLLLLLLQYPCWYAEKMFVFIWAIYGESSEAHTTWRIGRRRPDMHVHPTTSDGAKLGTGKTHPSSSTPLGCCWLVPPPSFTNFFPPLSFSCCSF